MRTLVPGLGHFDLITLGPRARPPAGARPRRGRTGRRIERVLEVTLAFLKETLG
jgi:hypothetical protein